MSSKSTGKRGFLAPAPWELHPNFEKLKTEELTGFYVSLEPIDLPGGRWKKGCYVYPAKHKDLGRHSRCEVAMKGKVLTMCSDKYYFDENPCD